MGAAKKALAEARPDIPEGLSNRLWDKWLPLIAIADEAGAKWPARAKAA